MSKELYDLDPHVGLMPEIMALIKPPDSSEESTRSSRRSHHPYYKRPGRGHNHDSCDACQEAGDLICCDRCPSSFHLGCHDPPLNVQDIPHGMWLCHSCKMMKKMPIIKSGSVDSQLQQKADLGSDNSRPTTPVLTEQEIINGLPVFGPQNLVPTKNVLKRSNSAFSAARISVSSDTNTLERCPLKTLAEKLVPQTPMDELIRAATLMNPKQFELPREMCIFQQFPGDDKVETKNGQGKKVPRNGSKYKQYELDQQNLVPLPAKTCFTCRKSCKRAPLVACDYCPLFFHLDCLDPPLTALPTGMWMCPNHAENFVDWHLLSSVAATERVKIWSKFSQPIDQDTVKAQFLRRVNFGQTPFRTKLKPRPRDRAVIPEMVQYHYKNPPKLLPSLRDVLRYEAVGKRPMAASWRRCKIEDDDEKLVHDIEADVREIRMANRIYDKLTNSDETTTQEVVVMEETSQRTAVEPEEKEIANGKVSENLPQLDLKLIKLLAYQRLQEILKDNSELLAPKTSHNFKQSVSDLIISSAHNVKPELPSQLLSPTEIERIAKLFEDESGLAESLIYEPDEPRLQIEMKTETAQSADRHQRIGFNARDSLIQSKILARAMLTFNDSSVSNGKLFHSDPSAYLENWRSPESLKLSRFMRYRKLTIGTAPDNDLVLSEFGICQQNSDKHAVIFFDEATRTFELLNYSEFGTEVGGQLYTLDFTEHAPPIKAEPSVRDQVLEILDRKRGIKRSFKYDSSARLPAPEKYSKNRCRCTSVAPLVAGWEGSAIINHGQMVKFGCLGFVFSMIPQHTEGDDEER